MNEHPHHLPLSRPTYAAGFTLIEMLMVVLMISILLASAIGIYWQARIFAWKETSRDSARQIAMAVNTGLMKNSDFPPAVATLPDPIPTTATNMAILCSNLEQSADQRAHGRMDAWGRFFYVRLALHHDGAVRDPQHDARTIHANVAVWSLGPNPDHTNDWIVISQ